MYIYRKRKIKKKWNEKNRNIKLKRNKNRVERGKQQNIDFNRPLCTRAKEKFFFSFSSLEMIENGMSSTGFENTTNPIGLIQKHSYFFFIFCFFFFFHHFDRLLICRLYDSQENKTKTIFNHNFFFWKKMFKSNKNLLSFQFIALIKKVNFNYLRIKLFCILITTNFCLILQFIFVCMFIYLSLLMMP